MLSFCSFRCLKANLHLQSLNYWWITALTSHFRTNMKRRHYSCAGIPGSENWCCLVAALLLHQNGEYFLITKCELSKDTADTVQQDKNTINNWWRSLDILGNIHLFKFSPRSGVENTTRSGLIWRISRCFVLWSKIVLCVGVFSIETKMKKKTGKKIVKISKHRHGYDFLFTKGHGSVPQTQLGLMTLYILTYCLRRIKCWSLYGIKEESELDVVTERSLTYIYIFFVDLLHRKRPLNRKMAPLQIM